MWALVLFSVFANTQAGAWEIHRGTSTVIQGFSSKETCENAGREYDRMSQLKGKRKDIIYYLTDNYKIKQ